MPRYRLGLGEWSLRGFLPAGTEVERESAPFGAELLPEPMLQIAALDEEQDSIVDVETQDRVPVKKGK